MTVGPVVRLWRRARRDRKLPDPELLAKARALVGSDRCGSTPRPGPSSCSKPGMKLDLGGIAKGYACDEAIAVLDARRASPRPGRRRGRHRRRRPAARRATAGRSAIAPLDAPGAAPRRFLLLQRRRRLDLGRRRAVRRDRRRALLAHRRPEDRAGPDRPARASRSSPATARPPTASTPPPTSSAPDAGWPWSRRPGGRGPDRPSRRGGETETFASAAARGLPDRSAEIDARELPATRP